MLKHLRQTVQAQRERKQVLLSFLLGNFPFLSLHQSNSKKENKQQ